MSDDSPIVREVRERAMRIEERFDHDLHKYCKYLRKQEQQHAERIVSQVTVVRAEEHGGRVS